MSDLLKVIDDWFKNTPREEILAKWEKAKALRSESDDPGPTVQEYFDLMSGKSQFEKGRQQREAEILALIEDMVNTSVPQQSWDTLNDAQRGWDSALKELKTRIENGTGNKQL